MARSRRAAVCGCRGSAAPAGRRGRAAGREQGGNGERRGEKKAPPAQPRRAQPGPQRLLPPVAGVNGGRGRRRKKGRKDGQGSWGRMEREGGARKDGEEKSGVRRRDREER